MHFLEWISIKITLKFVPNCPINNIPSLVQIMAWCRSGNKPLSEPMMVSLLTHNASLGLNALWLEENGWYLADSFLSCILLNTKFYILIQISMKLFSNGPVDNKSAVVHVVAWLWTGDKLIIWANSDKVWRYAISQSHCVNSWTPGPGPWNRRLLTQHCG